MNQEAPQTDTPYLDLKKTTGSSGIFLPGFKMNMRKRGPVWDEGNDRERTRVRVYEISDAGKLKWRIRWRAAGHKKVLERTHRDKEAAEADAKRIYKMLCENRVSIEDVDDDTLFQIRESELILANSGHTPASAARLLMSIIAQVPAGKTLNDVVQRGLAVLSNACRYEEPMSVVQPIYLEWLQRHNGLCKSACKTLSTVLNRLGGILGARPICDIDEMTMETFLTKYKAGSTQSHADFGRVRKFLRWARANGYFPKTQSLPTDFTELAPKRQNSEPARIYEAPVLRQILDSAPDDLRPALILITANLFRPEEAYAMTYEQLFQYWDDSWVWVCKSVAKRSKFRYLERWAFINPVTKHLFEPYMNRKGPLSPYSEESNRGSIAYTAWMRSVKIPLLKDSLRKSCISAHVAMGLVKQNVASWAGNSESITNRHYNNVAATTQYAYEWLGALLGKDPVDPAIKQMVAVFKAQTVRPDDGNLVKRDLINRKRE